jgi:hypothetical protein
MSLLVLRCNAIEGLGGTNSSICGGFDIESTDASSSMAPISAFGASDLCPFVEGPDGVCSYLRFGGAIGEGGGPIGSPLALLSSASWASSSSLLFLPSLT